MVLNEIGMEHILSIILIKLKFGQHWIYVYHNTDTILSSDNFRIVINVCHNVIQEQFETYARPIIAFYILHMVTDSISLA